MQRCIFVSLGSCPEHPYSYFCWELGHVTHTREWRVVSFLSWAREDRGKLERGRNRRSRFTSSSCCRLLRRAGFHLEGHCLSTEPQVVSQICTVREEGSQMGVMSVGGLNEVRLDLCPSPDASLSTEKALLE